MYRDITNISCLSPGRSLESQNSYYWVSVDEILISSLKSKDPELLEKHKYSTWSPLLNLLFKTFIGDDNPTTFYLTVVPSLTVKKTWFD